MSRVSLRCPHTRRQPDQWSAAAFKKLPAAFSKELSYRRVRQVAERWTFLYRSQTPRLARPFLCGEKTERPALPFRVEHAKAANDTTARAPWFGLWLSG